MGTTPRPLLSNPVTMATAYSEKDSRRINQRPLTLSSVETLEMFQEGFRDRYDDDDSETSACSAVLALQDTVQELDGIFDEYHKGSYHGTEDEDEEFDQELSLLKHSLQLLQKELNAVDLIIPSLGSSNDATNHNIDDRDMHDDAPENYVNSPLHEQQVPEPRMPPPPTTTGIQSSQMCDVTDCYTEICDRREAETKDVDTKLPRNSDPYSLDGSMAFSPFSYDEMSEPMDDGYFFCPGHCTPSRLSTETYFWEDDNKIGPPMSPLTTASVFSEKDPLRSLSMITELELAPTLVDTNNNAPTSARSTVSDDTTDAEYSNSLLMKSVKARRNNWSSSASLSHKSLASQQIRTSRSPIQRQAQKAFEIDLSSGHKRHPQDTLQTTPASKYASKKNTDPHAKDTTVGKSRQDTKISGQKVEKQISCSLLSESSDDSSSVYLRDGDNSTSVPPLSPRERKSIAQSLLSVCSDDSSFAHIEESISPTGTSQSTSETNSNGISVESRTRLSRSNDEEKNKVIGHKEGRLHVSVRSDRSRTVLYSFESENLSQSDCQQTVMSNAKACNNSTTDKYKALTSPQSAYVTHQLSCISQETPDSKMKARDKYKYLGSPESLNKADHCQMAKHGVSSANIGPSEREVYRQLPSPKSARSPRLQPKTRKGNSKTAADKYMGLSSPSSLSWNRTMQSKTAMMMRGENCENNASLLREVKSIVSVGTLGEPQSSFSTHRHSNTRKADVQVKGATKIPRNKTKKQVSSPQASLSPNRNAESRPELSLEKAVVLPNKGHIVRETISSNTPTEMKKQLSQAPLTQNRNVEGRVVPTRGTNVASSKEQDCNNYLQLPILHQMELVKEKKAAPVLSRSRQPGTVGTKLEVSTSTCNNNVPQKSSALPKNRTQTFTFVEDELSNYNPPRFHSGEISEMPFDEKEYTDNRVTVTRRESLQTPSCSTIDIPGYRTQRILPSQRVTESPLSHLSSQKVSSIPKSNKEQHVPVMLEIPKSPQEAPFDEKRYSGETTFCVEILEGVGNCIELICGDLPSVARSPLVTRSDVQGTATKKDLLVGRDIESTNNTCHVLNKQLIGTNLEVPRFVLEPNQTTQPDNSKTDSVDRGEAEICPIHSYFNVEEDEGEILKRNGLLLDRMVQLDHDGYRNLTDDRLVGVDLAGNNLKGNDIPRYYLEGNRLENASMTSPKVRFLSKSIAVVSYLRNDKLVHGQLSHSIKSRETRVWKKQNGFWINCHYHQTSVS